APAAPLALGYLTVQQGTLTTPAGVTVSGGLQGSGIRSLLGGGGLTLLPGSVSGYFDGIFQIDGPFLNQGSLDTGAIFRQLSPTATVTNAAGATWTIEPRGGLGLSSDSGHPAFTNNGVVVC